MSDTTNDEIRFATTNETAKAKKAAVSKREILNLAGAVQDDWVDAGGFSYTSLGENYEQKVLFTDLPDPIVRALAAFGGLTLAGNVTNTVRNGKNVDPETTEKSALIAWLDHLKAGNWTSERGEVEAGVGALAEAYVRAQAKAGVTMSVSEVAIKLKSATKETREAIRKNPQVKAELAAITAERAAAKASSAPADVMPSL